MLHKKITKNSNLIPIDLPPESCFRFSKMLYSMFSAPQILMANLVKIKYEVKQKQRARNTAFMTFAFEESRSYYAIGKRFMTKP
jgi:hypothetical protein